MGKGCLHSVAGLGLLFLTLMFSSGAVVPNPLEDLTES